MPTRILLIPVLLAGCLDVPSPPPPLNAAQTGTSRGRQASVVLGERASPHAPESAVNGSGWHALGHPSRLVSNCPTSACLVLSARWFESWRMAPTTDRQKAAVAADAEDAAAAPNAENRRETADTEDRHRARDRQHAAGAQHAPEAPVAERSPSCVSRNLCGRNCLHEALQKSAGPTGSPWQPQE